jgi:DNA-directed RNA polymerase subunit H
MVKKTKLKLDIKEHKLIPDHKLLSDKEKEKVLENFNITGKELPKILNDDTSIMNLSAKSGDIIKVTRESKSAGTATYYRVVING